MDINTASTTKITDKRRAIIPISSSNIAEGSERNEASLSLSSRGKYESVGLLVDGYVYIETVCTQTVFGMF